MSNKLFLTYDDVDRLAKHQAYLLMQERLSRGHLINSDKTVIRIYGVPRGGVPAALIVQKWLSCEEPGIMFEIVGNAEGADLIVDDIIDSGRTRAAYATRVPLASFIALIDKTKGDANDRWVVFPWEVDGQATDDSFTDNIVRLLQFIGEDSTREGLKETPARVAAAWQHWTAGYDKEAAAILKCFEDGSPESESCDEMVVVKDIPLYSKCEHHLADIFGTATVAYIPKGRIVGLSKISRLVDMFARRLQVQERMTNQIADSLYDHLQPLGVGVIIRARHMCMESRGICQQGHHTITSALRGVIKTNPQARAEFLELSK